MSIKKGPFFDINVQIFQDGQAQGIRHRFTRSLVNSEKKRSLDP